ncbi:ABC transporter permease [Pectinatus cerevisiiphilus]|uniref:NitT/TauT family transport system permease protein n=1 Tax=Pectinatus cerevisiiphilus TaxID=86956 RepID=A0A4R3K9C3_9FIRM|nr:ABC transporter permease [Pectinatus cerevisiiphilus]TCS79271.1 NitT/TauT family transport system permease protein [Pectinatus cerevisiiphilus]
MNSLLDAFMPKEKIKSTHVFFIATVAFAIILGIWAVFTLTGKVDPFFLPPPTEVVKTAINLFTQGDFIKDIGITVFRVMAGFIIAAVIALPLGLMIGTYAPVSAFLEYVVSFVRYLPASAFIPLFILWIGIDEPEKIAVIILGSLPQLILMIATNVRNVPLSMIEVSYTLGTTKANVLWKIILPKALPDIMDTFRTVLGWAWTYVIVAELVGASSGIGFMIIQSQRMMNTANIFVGILTIGLIGMIIDVLFKICHKKFFFWNN